MKTEISDANFYIFRSGKPSSTTNELLTGLWAVLGSLSSHPSIDEGLLLLLRAGELECSLSDVGSEAAHLAEQVTNTAATLTLAIGRGEAFDATRLKRLCCRISEVVSPQTRVSVAIPEGFAYYALHPLDYGEMAASLQLDSSVVCVVGIRSIGTTLSSVVQAKLREQGIAGERLTVRPVGHPYDRRCSFNSQQIRQSLAGNAAFLICDEGPGRSGSSFLSVAEALEREGVSADRITLLCGYEPNPETLCAPHAARRWSRYRTRACGITRRLPRDAGEFVGGGEWRAKFIPDGGSWPAAWTQMERLKYLSRDSGYLLKFTGYGHYGESVTARERALADSAFSPPFTGQSHGFSRHALVTSRPGCAADISPGLLTRMAEYCAWRARNCQVNAASLAELENATRLNFEAGFGELGGLKLEVERPVVADGRMQPHEWLCTRDGRWLKADATSHGDDHFFPGPCDIAWDLAGAVIEWDLNSAARKFFVSQYERLSHDAAGDRLPTYELAYATFRFAWCRMAASSMAGTSDETRLSREAGGYRSWLLRMKERCPQRAETLFPRASV